ncbi:hypothetical protein [Lysinibacter sp. HNR]|uniref:hypothetical protein n=1 Tax=Lysinibacter sp. HNR TaxID=3031408 RepID=UPI002435484F|nr:hypothetical protein [Lysinibacter sp. HNR]WGD36601.1 hypothetical protein FrondiHNR_09010 [Lysinibacter sp. HNR]
MASSDDNTQKSDEVETFLRDDDGLLPRLNIIEEQPLERRAEAYQQVYAELQNRLERGDSH